jgi:hypothetical protein
MRWAALIFVVAGVAFAARRPTFVAGARVTAPVAMALLRSGLADADSLECNVWQWRVARPPQPARDGRLLMTFELACGCFPIPRRLDVELRIGQTEMQFKAIGNWYLPPAR